MRSEYLAEFIELAYCLNFTAAAKKLNMSQSALSNHIGQLEKDLHAQLIIRPSSSNPARLTPAGEHLLDHAHKVIQLEEELADQLADERDRLYGELKIKFAHREFSAKIAGWLATFAQEHPHINFQVDFSQNGWVLDDLTQGAIDLACIGPLASASIEDQSETMGYIPLIESKMGIWVDDTCEHYAKQSISVSQIDGMTICITRNPRYGNWESCVEAFLARHDCSVRVIERICETMDEYAISKVRKGDILLASEHSLATPAVALRSDRRFVPFEKPACGFIGVAYRLDNNSIPFKALLTFLKSKRGESE